MLRAIAQHDLDNIVGRKPRSKASRLDYNPLGGWVTITYANGEQETIFNVETQVWNAIPVTDGSHGWVSKGMFKKRFVAECGMYWE